MSPLSPVHHDPHSASVDAPFGPPLLRLLVALVLALPLAAGCADLFKDPFADVDFRDIRFDIGDVDPTTGRGVGEACSASSVIPECRFGLRCTDGTCQPPGDTQQNRPCILTAECGPDLYCGLAGVCLPAGSATAGQTCGSSGDCARGLVCLSLGFSGTCVDAGANDIGAACAATPDCLAGLACRADNTCGAGSPTFGLKPWPGVTCEPEDPTGPARIHFEVPRPAAPSDAGPTDVDGDFFRLPFPNDIRKKDGRLDLSGFPTPGPGVVGFDPVDRVARAAEAVQKGFSNSPAILFRLSRNFDLGTVWANGIANPPPGEATLYFVNIDPDSPQHGWTPDFAYLVTDGGSRYVCPRYIAVHPAWYSPLLPETTYAVILADGIATGDGTRFGADTDMLAMLAATAPTDPVLAAAHTAYAPLRAFLASDKAPLPASRVIAAAVFTTQNVTDPLPALREVIRAAPAAQPTALTRCVANTTSPCDDGLTGDKHVRGCFGEHDSAHELHLKVTIPKVQAGTRPYLRPADGGDLVFAPDGRPILQGSEEVCVSLTIPKNVPMPASGWPLAIYGHGTGGTFRSSVRDAGLPLADIAVPASTEPEAPAARVGVAVLGWDGPMHGDRRGSELDPDGLFYNFANPRAARGNLYQGAADLFALVHAVSTWDIPAAQSPTGERIAIDPTRLLYVGHSQGATTGPLATPYEPALRSVVWSGAGGGLVLSLLAKKSPVDVPVAAAIGLQELNANLTPAELNDLHPALTLIQGLFDPVDPLNHASRGTFSRPAEFPPQHVLHVYGLGDTYTPPSTIETFARAMGLPIAAPVIKNLGPAFSTVAPPVRENLDLPGGKTTAVLVQVQPNGYDGHFVLFRDADMIRRFQQWVGTFVRDGAPTLVP